MTELQKYRNTICRNEEIEIIEIHNYNFQIDRNTNYRRAEIQIKGLQKYKQTIKSSMNMNYR